MNVVKVAIVGAGFMATEHARAFSALSNVKVVGVHSRSNESASRLAKVYDAAVFASVSEMYEGTKADVVVVAVPELAILNVASKVFCFPWVCLLEKPAGLNLAEAEILLKESKMRKSTVYVGLNRRSYSSTRQVLKILSQDSSPRIINIFDQQDMKFALKIGQPEEVVNNWMYANSIHLIDYFTLLGRGEVESVDIIEPWQPKKPGLVLAAIRFSSGDFGLYQAVWDGPGPWAVTVTTENSRLELRPLEKLTVQQRGERISVERPIEVIDEDFKAGLLYQAQQLLSVLVNEYTELPSLSVATQSMRLVARIYGLDRIAYKDVL